MDYKTLHSSVARLSQLSDEDFQSLTSCVSKHALKKGEKVLNEGEICRSLYFIEKGYLRTYYNKEGIAINLDFTFEQSFTSNVESFKSKQSSKLIIEAGEHALVWIFNISKLSHQDKSNPRLINLFRRIAIDILLSSKEYNNRLKIHTPAERYHYIEKKHPQLLQRVPLTQLASYIGVTRETLSRIRKKILMRKL